MVTGSDVATHRDGDRIVVYRLDSDTAELYDLSKDPAQENNLVADDPERAEELKKKYFSLESKTGESIEVVDMKQGEADLVGTHTEGASGRKDLHIRLLGPERSIRRVRVDMGDIVWVGPIDGIHYCAKFVQKGKYTDVYFERAGDTKGRRIEVSVIYEDGTVGTAYSYGIATGADVATHRDGDRIVVYRLDSDTAELYDLAKDPAQEKDLVADDPERAEELKKRYFSLEARTGESIEVVSVGQDGSDLVGTHTEGASGRKDLHIRLLGPDRPVKRVRVCIGDVIWVGPVDGIHHYTKFIQNGKEVNVYFERVGDTKGRRIEVSVIYEDGTVGTAYSYGIATGSDVATHRDGDRIVVYKLDSDTVELYDLAKDPAQENNLVADDPERAEELKKKHFSLEARTGESIEVVSVGRDGSDLVGTHTEGASGRKDLHIRLLGPKRSIRRVRVDMDKTTWVGPIDGIHHYAKFVQKGGQTDIYFEPVKEKVESVRVTVIFEDKLYATATFDKWETMQLLKGLIALLVIVSALIVYYKVSRGRLIALLVIITALIVYYEVSGDKWARVTIEHYDGKVLANQEFDSSSLTGTEVSSNRKVRAYFRYIPERHGTERPTVKAYLNGEIVVSHRKMEGGKSVEQWKLKGSLDGGMKAATPEGDTPIEGRSYSARGWTIEWWSPAGEPVKVIVITNPKGKSRTFRIRWIPKKKSFFTKLFPR
jgi:hypothetical protein